MPPGTDGIEVSISSSSKDRPWADQLYKALKAQGFDVFLDIHGLHLNDQRDLVWLRSVGVTPIPDRREAISSLGKD
jgi:hypothetical protein